MTDNQFLVCFNRRLHRLADILSVLFYYLIAFVKALNMSGEYLIDSFLVAGCDNMAAANQLHWPFSVGQGEEYRGKIALKRRFFSGFRVQLVTICAKQPVQLLSLSGSYVDVTALQMMPLNLPMGSEVYGDAGYTDYEK